MYPCLIPDSTRAKGNKGNRCWECMPCCYWNLITFFNQKIIDALVKCTRVSLDYLRKRMQPLSRYTVESDTSSMRGAFFNAEIVLEIPQVLMKPSIDDIQQVLNKAVNVILKLTQNVYEWKHHKLLHQLTNPVLDENSKGKRINWICQVFISTSRFCSWRNVLEIFAKFLYCSIYLYLSESISV